MEKLLGAYNESSASDAFKAPSNYPTSAPLPLGDKPESPTDFETYYIIPKYAPPDFSSVFADVQGIAAPLAFDGPSSCIVNYVYINSKVFWAGTGPDDDLCGIPLTYVDKMIENAKKYPQTQFQMWIDPDFLADPVTEFILASHLYFVGAANIKIRNLNDIPEYKDNPKLGKKGSWPMLLQADYARLLVVQDSLRNNQDHVAVYADFDVEDVMIDRPQFAESIKQNGFVLGQVKKGGLENGYCAFHNAHRKSGLLKKIIDKSDNTASSDEKGIYSIFTGTMKIFCQHKAVEWRSAAIQVLEPCGYKIPFNPEYDGICPA